MKNIKAITIYTIFAFSMISCSNNCDCDETWDNSVTYLANDLVLHDGKCWTATAQGRGITPGPWLQDGNDIWEECTE